VNGANVPDTLVVIVNGVWWHILPLVVAIVSSEIPIFRVSAAVQPKELLAVTIY
jgi:hypothetical protein